MTSLEARATRLEGVKVIVPPTIFEDHRGVYVETYNEELYRRAGVTARFVQDDISVSSRHVLRGIHADPRIWKLVDCLYGEFYLVVVVCDRSRPDFGRWEAFTLSDANHLQVLIPPRHGVAHLVLSEKAIFHYKQSGYYDRAAQATFRWDDPAFGIRWPMRRPILSERDRSAGE